MHAEGFAGSLDEEARKATLRALAEQRWSEFASGRVAYHAAKHALVGMTKSAALEYADQGIRINAICPGIIETPMVACSKASPRCRYLPLGLAQEWGEPIQVIRPGDVVWCPPGVKHWHGAAPTTAMTHMAVTATLDGKNVNWMEKVSDEQYNQAHQH